MSHSLMSVQQMLVFFFTQSAHTLYTTLLRNSYSLTIFTVEIQAVGCEN